MNNRNAQKRISRLRRHNRVRSGIAGTAKIPRLSVFRSSGHIYAQLINDSTGKTLAAASSLELKKTGKKSAAAAEVGKLIAEKAKASKIEKVVFDRGGYAYHGRVKALAEGAREAGLKF